MIITDIQPGRRNARRVNVYADGEFAFACYVEIASQFGLKLGVEIDEETAGEVQAADDAIAAREYAFGLAARGPRTEHQFREKLRQRGYSAETQAQVLEMLRSYGYLDDEAYARQFAEELFQRCGPWAVRRKLAERGIASEIIDRVIADGNSGGALEAQLNRLLARPKFEDAARERDRIFRSLASKGFDFGDIKAALRRHAEGDHLDL